MGTKSWGEKVPNMCALFWKMEEVSSLPAVTGSLDVKIVTATEPEYVELVLPSVSCSTRWSHSWSLCRSRIGSFDGKLWGSSACADCPSETTTRSCEYLCQVW